MALLKSVGVELGLRSYQVRIGTGLLDAAGPWVRETVRPSRAAVVTHPRIARLYGARLLRSLRRAGVDCFALEVPSGERQKSLRRAGQLVGELLSRGCDRRSVVIALGGGVIVDLAGFAAATFLRGVAFVQVPTTLLAQVDASVGGKVAVNHPLAKNAVGAFHQPSLVVADLDTLATLPAREFRSGLAEVVKHGVIADADLFRFLEREAASIVRLEPNALARIVARSVEIKAEVVRRDEREAGLRAILNLGHTVGHAVETQLDYRGIRHGEAVAIGAVAASRLGIRLCGLKPAAAERIEGLLACFGLPTRLPRGLAVAELLAAARRDKKAVAGRLRMVLPRRIGAVCIVDELPAAELRRVLRELMT